MNRREFLKLLGEATIVSGIALAAGLPKEKTSTVIRLDEYARLMGVKLPLRQDYFTYIGGSLATPHEMWAMDEKNVKWFSDDSGETWMLAMPQKV